MKWQTNEELGPFINHWGCFFCSILEKVEKSTGWTKHFSNANVIGIYQTGMDSGWITKEVWEKHSPVDGCFVINAPEVYNYAAQFIGVASKCTGYRKVGKIYVPARNEEEILCLARDGYNGVHFVAGTGITGDPWQKEIEFDPIEGGSNCAKLGWIDSKRILTLEV